MAVGGVTRKIEGFFKVYARHGLTGSQGVIIPRDNVDHLMLAPDVLEAVEKKQFAIFPVRRIEEALTLLTGMAAGRRRKNGSFTPGSLYAHCGQTSGTSRRLRAKRLQTQPEDLSPVLIDLETPGR